MVDEMIGETAVVRRGKSAAAFRTISEVAEELDVPQHVLRFWETKFGQIRPLKRGGGRRYYRPEDIVLLQRIRRLLYDEGYTIKGVQRLLRERGAEGAAHAPPPTGGAHGPGLSGPGPLGDRHPTAPAQGALSQGAHGQGMHGQGTAGQGTTGQGTAGQGMVGPGGSPRSAATMAAGEGAAGPAHAAPALQAENERLRGLLREALDELVVLRALLRADTRGD